MRPVRAGVGLSLAHGLKFALFSINLYNCDASAAHEIQDVEERQFAGRQKIVATGN
jgi:hypothetical protein